MGLGGRAFLFTGDIGEDAERAITRAGRELACDLLKVPHHGSRSSSSEGFLSRLRPRAAVISVGRGNTYRHPSEEAVRLERSGTRILRTDRDGAVIVTLRDGEMRITPWAELLLQRISLDDAAGWPDVERKNWKRVWERIRM
jgi:competence protein ComEC